MRGSAQDPLGPRPRGPLTPRALAIAALALGPAAVPVPAEQPAPAAAPPPAEDKIEVRWTQVYVSPPVELALNQEIDLDFNDPPAEGTAAPLLVRVTPDGSHAIVNSVTGLMAYDLTTGTMYGITGCSSGNSKLVRIDLATGAATIVGACGFEAGSLEFGPDGRLYAGSTGAAGGYLYRIDKSSGEVKERMLTDAFTMPPSLSALVREAAREDEVSKSKFVREAILEKLASRGTKK